ncbi:MAG: glycosyltransferase [Candidatus Moraniibacteriota bacterium]
MNILEINKFYYPRRGAERHMLDVVALLRQHGHDVSVFAMRHPDNMPSPFERYFPSFVGYNESDSTLWQRVKGIGRLFWSSEARKKLARLLDDVRPDIVHIHNIYHQLSLSILPVVKRRGIPIVMTVHDYHLVSPDKDQYHASVGRSYWKFLFVKKYGFGKRLLLVLKTYWEKCFRFYECAVDAYIVPSEYCKKVLVHGGIAESKIAVIPHFIADTHPQSESDAMDEKKEDYAIYFGALSAAKGADKLAELFDRFRYPLVLAGNIEEGFAVPESRWVRYVGQKSRQELDALIRGATFVVSGSALPETFGLIILESFACGKPFFGLDAGAFSEIVTDGENGYIAADWQGLEARIREFIAGKTILSDGETIRRQALECFGEERYYAAVQEIFASLRVK